jgi:CRP/FNR family cyclic AMP-dependent transcriptional regulator
MPSELSHVPLFSLLDSDELAVLSQQVERREFADRQRIYKVGDTAPGAYVVLEGAVRVTIIDEDGQEVLVSEARHGDVFGIASLLEKTPHQTTAITTEPTVCLEIDRQDLSALLDTKPQAGLDMLTVLARQMHAAQKLVRDRTARNPNEVIDNSETFGERIADKVATFGGSWKFIISFGVFMVVHVSLNVVLVVMRGHTWDPYPFILLNLVLSMLAAIQAPVIMMSQNRQDQRDRVRSELDFDVNRRAETEIQGLARKLNAVSEKVDDLAEKDRAKGNEQ